MKTTENKSKTSPLKEQSFNMYKDFYENAPDMYVSVDPHTAKIIHCNHALIKNTGYTKDEIVGRPILEMYHPDCMDDVRKAFQQFVETGEIHNAELQLQRKDGSTMDVILNVSSAYDDQGNILYSRSALRDISDRKQLEQSIKIEHRYVQSILRAAPIGIGVIVDRVFKFVNERFLEITGYAKEELVGQNARLVYPSKEEYERVGEQKYADIKRSGTGNIETQFKKKDGTIIDIFLSSTPLDPRDQSLGVTFTALDITKHKQTERSLRENLKLNSAILNAIPDIIYIYDLVGKKYDYNNDGISKILGYSVAEIKEMGERIIPDLMHPDDFKIYIKETLPRYLLAQDDEVIEHEYRMKCKRGKWHWLYAKETICSRQADGTPQKIFGINADITERKQAEKELEKHRHKQEELVKERTKELEEKNAELERYNRLFVGREFRIKELKEKVKELEGKSSS